MANKRQRSIEGRKRRVPFCETETREVSAKEMQAEKRAIEQELNATRTGGISIVGPLKFPLGPLPWGKGKKKMPKNPPQEAASSPRGPTLGGMPPGLSLPSPREADIIELAPKAALATQTQRSREKDHEPRISEAEYRSFGRALDIWARIENPGGNPDITDDIFYEEGPMRFAKQGRIF